MKTLVAYASAHGSTRGVAERLAATFKTRGIDVDVHPIEAVASVNSFDACVIGSPIYVGSWMAEAVAFVEANADVLAQRPVWLFSLGPLDKQGGLLAKADWPEAKEIEGLRNAVNARDHRMFTGAIQPDELSFLVRLFFRLSGGRYGDFRKWDEIDGWANEIADHLTTAGATDQ